MEGAFLVLTAKRGASLREPHRVMIEQPSPPHLPFEATDHTTWSSETGGTVMGAWQRCHPHPGGERRWHVDRAGASMVVGSLWWASAWVPPGAWAALARGGPELRGIYAAVEASADGSVRAFADPLGFRLIYYGETSKFVAIGSNAALVAQALRQGPGTAPRDPLGIAWLACTRHLIGDRTGFAGVRVLPPGSSVRAGPDGCQLERPAPRDVDRVDHDSASEHISRLGAEISDVLLGSMTGPFAHVIVDLTGGKDTRVLLAGVIAAGLRDRVRFRTVGPPHLGDVQVARQLADRLDLDHEVLGALPQEQLPYSDRLADFVARTGGMSNIWNAQGRRPARDELRIQGIPGEMLRTYRKVPRQFSTTEDLIGFVRNRVLRSELELVGPEARSTFEQIAIEDVLETEPNLEPAERLHLFSLRHRVRFARYGPLEEISTEARVHPLYSLDGLSTALALGAPGREAEAIHRRLVEQVSLELADLPFAGEGWPGVKKPRPPAASTRPAGAAPTDSPSKAEPLVARAMRTSFARRREVLGDVLGDLHNDAWSVLDRPAVVRAFDQFDSLGALGKQELHGALTCCLWLGSVRGDRSRTDVEQSFDRSEAIGDSG